MGSGIRYQNAQAEIESAEATLTPERGPAKEQVGPPSDSEEEGQASEPGESEQHDDNDSSSSSSNNNNNINKNNASNPPPLPQETAPPPGQETAPPLPREAVPPLPQEAPPGTAVGTARHDDDDDGWDPVWDESAQAFYFYNRFTRLSQWENPRVPQAGPPGVVSPAQASVSPGAAAVAAARPHGGYDPSIHGDYDPTAAYAVEASAQEQLGGLGTAAAATTQTDAAGEYAAKGTFNRFTGRWQGAEITAENYSDSAKSKRQMNAFFDVDSAANSHQGKSLKAERSGLKLTKQELKAYKEKRKERKEEKRRAWLRD